MNLLLIFTFDVSLKSWEESGLFSRETHTYRVLYEKYGVKTTFLTFGNNEDLLFEEALENINIVPIYEHIQYSNSKVIRFIKSIYFCLKYRSKFENIDIIKTNQLSGSWVGSYNIVKTLFYGQVLTKLFLLKEKIETKPDLLFLPNWINNIKLLYSFKL